MNNGTHWIAAAATGLMLSHGVAFAQGKPPDCLKLNTPEVIEGHVSGVNASQGRLTLRAADGTLHELQASKATLGAYKLGDPIKAKLRKDPRCN